MLRILLTAALLLTNLSVEACETGAPLSTQEARQARHVFVFRVLSTQMGDTDFSVTGKVRVIANVRGRTTADEIMYHTGYCGGISLDPGKDYIGFLSSDAKRFRVDVGNTVPLFFGRFTRREADNLEALLRGKKEMGEAFAFNFQTILPPPPPSPSPERGRKPSGM